MNDELSKRFFEESKEWMCTGCGERCDAASPAWRWTGEQWEHSHGYPVGHVNAVRTPYRTEKELCVEFILMNGGKLIEKEKESETYDLNGYGVCFDEKNITFLGDIGDFAEVSVNFYAMLGCLWFHRIIQRGPEVTPKRKITPDCERFEQAVNHEALYNELLYAVGKKFPGETRHQTALRYIRRMEDDSQGPGSDETLANQKEENDDLRTDKPE